MGRRYTPQIPFEQWVAVDRPNAGAIAREGKGLPTEMRIERAAWERMHRDGHARFEPGELVEIIGMDRTTVYRALERLKANGVVYDGSTVRCIQVVNSVAAYSGPGASDCDYCGDQARKARRKRQAEQDVERRTLRETQRFAA